ncbi:MAG: hypothetical protein RLN81_14395, partial [Balneolaceae bacterium]
MMVGKSLLSVLKPIKSVLAFDPDHVASSDTLDQISRSFNSEMTPRQITIPFNTGLSVSLGNEFVALNKEFGYIVGFSHNRSFSAYDNGQNGIYQLIGSLDNDTELNALNELRDTRTEENIDLGG